MNILDFFSLEGSSSKYTTPAVFNVAASAKYKKLDIADKEINLNPSQKLLMTSSYPHKKTRSQNIY